MLPASSYALKPFLASISFAFASASASPDSSARSSSVAPSSAMASVAFSVGATRRIMELRIRVPASLPTWPALAVTAISVISSSGLAAKRMVEPIRSIASPNSSMVLAELLAA